MDTASKPKEPPARLASYVRFSPDEFERIEKDHIRRHVSIPELLKEAYFGKPPVAILMTQEEQKSWIRELNQMGNNLNQITRKINAGFRTGLDADLAQIRQKITSLFALITARIGTIKT